MEEEIEFNPKGRRLCPDGSCVGLVGPDGRCGECGRVAGPATAASGAETSLPDDAPAVEDTDQEVVEAAPGSTGRGGGGAGFDAARKLCDDGTCVGVVENGRCNVCGRVASS